MPIRRTADRTRNFTVVPNDVINDERLSARARCVLIYLLSKPDSWRPNQEQVRGALGLGRAAVATAFRELEELGYLELTKVRQAGSNLLRTAWIVTDQPGPAGPGEPDLADVIPIGNRNRPNSPVSGAPGTGGSASGGPRNPTVVRTEGVRTDQVRTEKLDALERAEPEPMVVGGSLALEVRMSDDVPARTRRPGFASSPSSKVRAAARSRRSDPDDGLVVLGGAPRRPEPKASSSTGQARRLAVLLRTKVAAAPNAPIGAVNIGGTAKNISTWLAEGAPPDRIEAMIETFISKLGFYLAQHPNVDAWIVFLRCKNELGLQGTTSTPGAATTPRFPDAAPTAERTKRPRRSAVR